MKLSKIQTLLTIISFVFAAFFFIDSRYALSGHLESVELRLEHKVLGDRSYAVQSRIWKLEDRFPDGMPPTVKEEYRLLVEEKKVLDDIIKELIKHLKTGGK